MTPVIRKGQVADSKVRDQKNPQPVNLKALPLAKANPIKIAQFPSPNLLKTVDETLVEAENELEETDQYRDQKLRDNAFGTRNPSRLGGEFDAPTLHQDSTLSFIAQGRASSQLLKPNTDSEINIEV